MLSYELSANGQGSCGSRKIDEMETKLLTAFRRQSIPRVTFSFACGSRNLPGANACHRFAVIYQRSRPKPPGTSSKVKVNTGRIPPVPLQNECELASTRRLTAKPVADSFLIAAELCRQVAIASLLDGDLKHFIAACNCGLRSDPVIAHHRFAN